MQCHVVVPGLFGTQLVDSGGEIVWPPGLVNRPISSTELVDLMTAPTTTTGKVIRSAECAGDVYGPLLDRLAARRGRVLPMPYDWRTDIRTAADALAKTLAGTAAGEEIVLIGHSMGGLVVRWLLECGDYAAQPWFGRVTIAVLICAPHFGAPLAVMRVLGLDGIKIILPGWAMRALASDPANFPAGYQLLPAPDIDCVSRPANVHIDVYEAFPGFNPVGAAKVRAIHAKLDLFARPDHIPYHIAYGVGTAATVAGLSLIGTSLTETMGDGDGTVPAWSGNPTASNAAAKAAIDDVKSFVADHVGILGNARFLVQLDEWLNSAIPVA